MIQISWLNSPIDHSSCDFVSLPRFGASHPELKQVVSTGSPGPLIQSCLTHRVLQPSAAPARKCSILLTGHLHPSWLIYQRGWGR